jgi:ribose 5-phosphate isomerase A
MPSELSPIDKAKYVAARRAVEYRRGRHARGARHRVDGGLDGALPCEMVREEGMMITTVATSTRTAELARVRRARRAHPR